MELTLMDNKDKIEDNTKEKKSREKFPTKKNLEKKLKELRNELITKQETEDMYLDQLKRLKAEFENYRKRMLRQVNENFEAGMKKIALDLLVVLDNFKRALDSKKIDLNGIDLINREFINILKNKGLNKMDVKGNKFDPNFHHAISFIETEADEDGKIMEVIQLGYLWKDEVLRPAMVIVAKEKEKPEQEEDLVKEKISEKEEPDKPENKDEQEDKKKKEREISE